MSSNDSVERMLKEIKNLLRQQDRDQGEETAAGLEPVAAESGSPGPAEEKEAEDLPATPAVEGIDSVESQASVDEAREPAHTATWDPVSVGVPGAQGLQVETVPSEEDWYEIGEPEPVETGVNSEQAPAASETPAEAQAGPGLDSSGVAEIGPAEVDVPTMKAEAEPVRPDEDVPDDTQASADSSAVTEAGEDAESPTGDYPNWWFRGGAVYGTEDGENVGASSGGGDSGATDDHGSDGRGVEETTETAARAHRPAAAEREAEEFEAAEEVAHIEEVEVPKDVEPDPVAPLADQPAAKQPADSMSERPRRRLTARLGTLLRDAHLISERDLDRALAEHQAAGQRLGHYLVAHGMVQERDLANVLSAQYGMPAADVETLEIPGAVLALVPVKMVRRYMVLPVAVSGGVVDVAMVDPSDSKAIKDIEFTTGLRVQPLIATEWSVERAIERIYGEEELRSALPGGSAKAADTTDPRTIIRGMVRDRDEAVLQAEHDPHRAYELAASIDDFVDEILKAVEKPQD